MSQLKFRWRNTVLLLGLIAFFVIIVALALSMRAPFSHPLLTATRKPSPPTSDQNQTLPFDSSLMSNIDTSHWNRYCSNSLGVMFKYPPQWHVEEYSIERNWWGAVIIAIPPDGESRQYQISGDGRVDFGVEISPLGLNPSTIPGVTQIDVRTGTIERLSIPFASTTITIQGRQIRLAYNIFNAPLGITAYTTLTNQTMEVSFDRFFSGQNGEEDWIGFLGISATLNEAPSC